MVAHVCTGVVLGGEQGSGVRLRPPALQPVADLSRREVEMEAMIDEARAHDGGVLTDVPLAYNEPGKSKPNGGGPVRGAGVRVLPPKLAPVHNLSTAEMEAEAMAEPPPPNGLGATAVLGEETLLTTEEIEAGRNRDGCFGGVRLRPPALIPVRTETGRTQRSSCPTEPHSAPLSPTEHH